MVEVLLAARSGFEGPHDREPDHAEVDLVDPH
jgi:hypothetical protein